jgi:hypothetical protein
VTPLGSELRTQWDREPFLQLRGALFGADATPEDVSGWISQWCRQCLGADVVSTWLWHASVAWVLGVHLEDGVPVVVRFGVPDYSNLPLDHIEGVVALRKLALQRGLTAPAVLVDPQPLGEGWVMAEAALLTGRPPVGGRPVERSTMARGWVELATTLDDALASHLTVREPMTVMDGLYSKPHSSLFDFEATSDGAAWIDELAAAANRVVAGALAPTAAAHSDWRPDNLRVDGCGHDVVAIYDWESIRARPLTIGLGSAAAQFTLTFAGDAPPRLPTADECLAFADAAERARGVPFTVADWREIRGSIVQTWCYTARCEHALAVSRGEPPDTETPASARLRTSGEKLLGW